MTDENKYFYVKSYCCDSTEDDYVKGEIGGFCASWDGSGFSSRDMKFDSIKAALAQILKEQCYDEEEWLDYFGEYGNEHDRGRFDCDILVDENNYQATERQIEKWRDGKCKLYNCHITAYIGVRSDREISDEEYKSEFSH